MLRFFVNCNLYVSKIKMDGIQRIIGSQFLCSKEGGLHVTPCRYNGENKIDVAPVDYWVLYFSASWCPPCKKVTPRLMEFYQKSPASVEVLFISADKSEEEYQKYANTMPWLSIDYRDQVLIDALRTRYYVEGIPAVVVVSRDGELIHENAVDKLMRDPGGFPWLPPKHQKSVAPRKSTYE